MSGGAKKRPCIELLRDAAAAKPAVAPSHTVIVAGVGDMKPDELVADAVTTFFINQGRSVSNYVLLPDFELISRRSFFVANYDYLEPEDPSDPKKPRKLQKRYVKKVIPTTAHLVHPTCEVMVLLCHGAPRTKQFATSERAPQPHFLSFYEGSSVDVYGIKSYPSDSSRIWTCKSYRHTESTGDIVVYKKPDDGVLLHDVVKHSKLVLLLACCGTPIMDEYKSEGEGQKPDFVVFSRPSQTTDIAMNIFLAMLMTAMEQCPRDMKFDRGSWDEVVRRNVCQVLLWVKEHGHDGSTFWRYLQTERIITPGQQRNNPDAFRIKGFFNSQALELDEKTGKDDTLLFLEELQTLTLMIWIGGSAVYDNIDYTRSKQDLESWINGKLAFRGYPGSASNPVKLGSPDADSMQVAPTLAEFDSPDLDSMLLRLRDLASG